jgi:hypothetical protein
MLKLIITIVASVVSFVSLGASTTTSPQTGRFEGEGGPTRFKLSAEKNTYYAGEPVELIMTLYNDRNKPIQGDLYPDLYNTWIYHRKGGGEFVRYFPRWLQINWDPGDIFQLPRIPAHGKIKSKVSVFYNTYYKQLVLPEAGEYEFKATYMRGRTALLESKIVRIRAIEPPEEERAALAMLRDPELASFVEGDLRPSWVEVNEVEAGAEKAAAFLQEHGRSMYVRRVKEQLKFVVEEVNWEGGLTPKMKEIQALLREQR